jgi:hypothetical protein
MKLRKFVVVGFLALGLVAASFAGTNPEWRPFKLGLKYAASQPAQPGSRDFPMIELAIGGGFMGGFGLLTAENVASDLLTGMSSPWYGVGHSGFYWSTTGPAKLDTAIGGSMLKKDGGALAGLKLGFNLSRTIQAELYFNYGFAGYSVDQAVWDEFATSKARTTASLTASGRTLLWTDNSLQKAGKTIVGGLNLNFGFPTGGGIMPYVSVGAGIMSVSDLPLISWSLNQSSAPGNSGTYGMDISYESKMAILFNGGLGLKLLLGPNYGLKIEGRGNMALVSLDKMLETDFARTNSTWVAYTPYSGTALTEKGSPIFISAFVGFFYGF